MQKTMKNIYFTMNFSKPVYGTMAYSSDFIPFYCIIIVTGNLVIKYIIYTKGLNIFLYDKLVFMVPVELLITCNFFFIDLYELRRQSFTHVHIS